MTDKPAESAVERYETAEVSECRMVIGYGVIASVPVIAKEKADAALTELKAENEALRRERDEDRARHAVEVTGLLRSMMGYLTALTASSGDMVTFVAQKLEPYHAWEDDEARAGKGES